MCFKTRFIVVQPFFAEAGNALICDIYHKKVMGIGSGENRLLARLSQWRTFRLETSNGAVLKM